MKINHSPPNYHFLPEPLALEIRMFNDEKTFTMAKKTKKLDRQMGLTGRADTGFHSGSSSSKLSIK